MYNFPNKKQLKKMSIDELKVVANEARKLIIYSVRKNAGHLSSNLGSVESIMAMHYVFNCDSDYFYFDIGHQTYTHKFLTGRANMFENLRKRNGAEAFLRKYESKYDIYGAGRSSTAPDVALGHALAKKITKANYEVLSYIGDASFQSGIPLEFMNHVTRLDLKVITIINENEMSISVDVGTIGQKLREQTKKYLNKNLLSNGEMDPEKAFLKPTDKNNIFNLYNIAYIGPVDGHNFKQLFSAYKLAKNYNKAVMIHVHTIKGKTLSFAENDRLGIFHGAPVNFDLKTGEVASSNTIKRAKVFTDAICKEMKNNKKIVLCTPGMGAPNYNDILSRKQIYPNRVYDFGINEELQCLSGLGMKNGGLLPYLDYYSSFITRAYDQIIQDITRARSSAIFTMHDSGFATASGDSHHTLYDLACFINLPNTIIASPNTIQEINDVIHTGVDCIQKQKVAYMIRGSENKLDLPKNYNNIKGNLITIGKWKYFHKAKQKNNSVIISYDYNLQMLKDALDKNNVDIDIVNALYIKPFDIEFIKLMIKENRNIYIYEDNYWTAGLGAFIVLTANRMKLDTSKIHVYGSKLDYFTKGTIEDLKGDASNSISDFIANIIKILKNY